MNTYNVILLVQVRPNMFDAKIFPVLSNSEGYARLEGIADYVAGGGSPGSIVKVSARAVHVDGPVRISKVPTLAGLSPVSF
jgi:hypothetical protein